MSSAFENLWKEAIVG